MKVSFASALVVALAAETTVASSWFSKAVYNKWHETELERWLSDHNVPYPTPADRKDLESLVKTNWQAAVESPYAGWDAKQLSKYLNARGIEAKKGAEKNKDSLVGTVKSSWDQAEGSATNAYSDVKTWIFDSWTDSSLKSFADKNGIPSPQPRTRDSLLKIARENYQTVANKAGETAAYPGNWLYASWSDSDLKAWLDERGIPVPQTGARDKMIASVRRNAYVAGEESRRYLASASKSANAAQQTLSEAVFDAWSDSEIKAWADKNSIKVPQGSNRNELLAIARKNVAKLTGDNVSAQASSAAASASKSGSSAYGQASKSGASAYDQASKSGASAYGDASNSAASAYGAATSSAGNEYARASGSAVASGNYLYAQASSVVVSIINEVQIAVGLKTNYASSASRSAASVSAQASKSGLSLSGQASKSASSLSSKASKSAQSVKNEL